MEMDFKTEIEQRWLISTKTFVIFLLLYFTCLLECSSAMDCPKSCYCSKEIGLEINCSGSKLSSLPEDIPMETTTLILDFNRFKHFPDISNLKNLTKLSLSGNLIEHLEIEWNVVAPSLQSLNISHNLLEHISAMNGLNKLQILDFSHNRIKNISGLSSAFPQLRFLIIHHNKIQDINVIRQNKMPKLFSLNAGYNQIGSLISSVDKETAFPNLKILELNNNNITTIDMYLMRFKALSKLVLSYNEMKEITPATFLGNYDLTELHVDNNRLKRITNAWFTFKQKLTFLNISHNNIEYIDNDVFKSSINILTLDVSHNHLLSLKKEIFLHLGNLTYLYLQHNRMQYVSEHAFRGLVNLHVLDMSDNEISLGRREFDRCFKPLVNLKTLYLHNNLVLMLPSTSFLGLSNLQSLDLRGNDIKIVETGAFSSLLNVKRLLLDATDMICTCSSKYLRDWTNQHGFQSLIHARCSSPKWLSGKSVLELLDSELVCEKDRIGFGHSFRPKVIQHPFSKHAFRQGEANFTCVATASVNSPMFIYWYHGNNLVRQEFVMTSKQEPISSRVYRRQSFLRLRGVQFEEAGDYWCYVANIYGSDWSVSANLTVVVRPQLSLRLKREITERSGKDIFIPCSATGIPTPKVQFTKIDGEKPFPAVRDKRLIFTHAHEFGIERLKIEDTGVYSCMATSAVGMANSTIKLTVIEEPKFMKSMLSKKVVLGKTAVLDCAVSGYPIPTVTWYKNNKQIVPSKRIKLSSRLLVMVGVGYSDEGIYECVAKNRLGTARQSGHVTVTSEEGKTVAKGSSKLPTEVFISVVLLTIIAVIVLTSLVWATLLCRLRKKRREGMQKKEEELMSRYVEESLLCRDLPKKYTLRYHGQLVKVPNRPHINNDDSLRLFSTDMTTTRDVTNETSDDYYQWSSHERDTEQCLENHDVEEDSGISVAYPNSSSHRVSDSNANARRFLSLYRNKPYEKEFSKPSCLQCNDNNFQTSTMILPSMKKRNEVSKFPETVSDTSIKAKSFSCKSCNKMQSKACNGMQSKSCNRIPANISNSMLYNNSLDISNHKPPNNLQNRPPDNFQNRPLDKHDYKLSEKLNKSLTAINMVDYSKPIDFDPTRLKRHMIPSGTAASIHDDMSLNYITSSSGVDSGNSSESLNNNEFIELQSSLT